MAAEGCPGGPQAHAAPLWYLSFDCATKTFAFSLSRIDVAAIRGGMRAYRSRLGAARELVRRVEGHLARGEAGAARALGESARRAVEALDRETRALIRIADGETVDLFPGVPDRAIKEVPRVRAVARYVAARVRPAMAALIPPGETYCVLVEFQMALNAHSPAVAAALVALFAEEDVREVGPSLKNKMALGPTGRYGLFTARYAKTYDANKAHARHNFELMEAAVGTAIPPSAPELRGHIADSFMQVLGYLCYGKGEDLRGVAAPKS